MIKVKVKESHIEIKGHAYYDEYGKDIVCAAVSSIVITTVNGILSIEKETIKCEEKKGFISIEILKNTHITDKLISNMINMLKELESKYDKNIKIEEVR